MGTLTRGRIGRPARELDYAVIDVETTGLHPAEGARMCEIAVIRMRGDGTVLREFTTLVDPGAPVDGQIFHGIGQGDVVGAPKAGDLVGEVAELISGAVLVGHKLDFEGRFLEAELVPAGLPAALPGLCTLRALRSQVGLARYSLPRASHALNGHWPAAQHTALGDARACAQLLAELLQNSPGELRYTGPAPVSVSVSVHAESTETVRLKPRVSVGGTLHFSADRSAPARPLAAWPPCWRPLELDPELCGGSFGAEQRRAAADAALRRRRRREAMAAAVAATGALAAAAAVRRLLRGGR
ncbi:PolC-type DNA polymerase III [Nocardiopsis sediminis]|uniref:PolC-type DNA polymerase III n=1 Tax=Nocardiopsis sediminis TaxID=1778267 RepID=A0ABV8FWV0_9ACTN